MHTRRSRYDVSNRINVTDPVAVGREILDLYTRCYAVSDTGFISRALHDFTRLYSGELPGYEACDTLYHDMQHTLDATLAVARLIYGHDRDALPGERLGPERFRLGVIVALFHDAGYIRRRGTDGRKNGAEYTLVHVSRSAEFLAGYLPQIGLTDQIFLARQLVHFTGYERELDNLALPSPANRRLGEIIGTGDLIAQLADRCYLEKCRDRLYPEFVLGGLTQNQGKTGGYYRSGEDLLRGTPQFFDGFVRQRLEQALGAAYRYAAKCFGGHDFYQEAMEQNIAYLRRLIAIDRLDLLRRRPPRTPGMELFPLDQIAVLA